MPTDVHETRAGDLALEQLDLVERVEAVVDAIHELPNGAQEFGQELQTLGRAQAAMEDALALLDDSETAAPTVAAETEAIEELLRARRSGGGGGGGGGNSPGGGGSTDAAEMSALALAGRSLGAGTKVDERESRAAAAATSAEVPEELRASLDRYFERLGGR